MKDDVKKRINKIIAKKNNIEEADIRSLMVLLRKLLDFMPYTDQKSFLIIRLFANWVVHNEISNSNTGLRILSAINNALVAVARSTDMNFVCYILSQTIGLSALRKEMKKLFDDIDADGSFLLDDNLWGIVISHLIEIIRGVPISFPKLSELDPTKRSIYEEITQNNIKSGAGVIAMQIADIRCDDPNETWGNRLCLLLKLENKSQIAVPLLIDITK